MLSTWDTSWTRSTETSGGGGGGGGRGRSAAVHHWAFIYFIFYTCSRFFCLPGHGSEKWIRDRCNHNKCNVRVSEKCHGSCVYAFISLDAIDRHNRKIFIFSLARLLILVSVIRQILKRWDSSWKTLKDWESKWDDVRSNSCFQVKASDLCFSLACSLSFFSFATLSLSLSSFYRSLDFHFSFSCFLFLFSHPRFLFLVPLHFYASSGLPFLLYHTHSLSLFPLFLSIVPISSIFFSPSLLFLFFHLFIFYTPPIVFAIWQRRKTDICAGFLKYKSTRKERRKEKAFKNVNGVLTLEVISSSIIYFSHFR